ncbi:hypothetical protein MMC10_008803 [Thelotrema lepadinum]|nr:hypothetical protein [Thelotrema lepadinum]
MPSLLSALTEKERLGLCNALWEWEVCADCLGSKCRNDDCPAGRLKTIQQYFEYYQEQCLVYERTKGEKAGNQVLSQHEDLFNLVRLVRSELHLTKQGLAQKTGDDVPWVDETAMEKRMVALDLAGKVLYMVPCSTDATSLQDTAVLEPGTNRAPWQSDSTFFEHFSVYFPSRKRRTADLPRDLSDLNAENLSHVGVTFVPTDDLSSHLRFDPKAMKVQIFHHGAFLKENLRQSKEKGDRLSPLSREEVLRRLVYLEILDSTQKLLFPCNSRKSFALLKHLVHKHGLDASILSFESGSIRARASRETEPSYQFLARRIMDLYEELQNPTPRGRFEQWLERRSGARYAMMATMIGVAFAVFLGFLSLGVSVLQAWIAWQTWKHPINT